MSDVIELFERCWRHEGASSPVGHGPHHRHRVCCRALRIFSRPLFDFDSNVLR